MYGRRFKVRPEWLLTGDGGPDLAPAGSHESIGLLDQTIHKMAAAIDRNSAALVEITSEVARHTNLLRRLVDTGNSNELTDKTYGAITDAIYQTATHATSAPERALADADR